MTLKFVPSTHRYFLDAKPCPGVTSLISGGLPKTLHYWSARTVAEYVADNREAVESLYDMGRGPMVAALKETPWAVRDAAANRGTEVHDLAEKLIHGKEIDVPEELAGHVESCVRFLDEWRVEPIVTEVSVGNREHWYAGRLDAIVQLPDSRLILLDWKTNRSGIFAETAFQISAYRFAEFYVTDDAPDTELPMPVVDETWAVHIRGDGYDVIPVKADEATFREFRHIAYVSKVAKRMKDYVGAAITAPTTTEGISA